MHKVDSGHGNSKSSLLKKVNKGITIAELEHVLKLTSQYGIWTGIEVICGLPHEREEDINTTIDFLVNNKEHIDRIYQNIFDLRDNSLMLVKSKDYGIENIQKINCYREEKSYDFNLTNFVRYKFDEIDGLKWEDKKKQMVDSYRKVLSVNTSFVLPEFLDEHFLFYLYARFNEKSVIKKYYSEAAEFFSNKATLGN